MTKKKTHLSHFHVNNN
jgi:hypothetical protein